MGARLAAASEARVAALAAFAQPLGVAFQLRDDVLGTFGDPRVTGKPAGSDLLKGKRTALLVDALGDARAAEALRRVLGRPEASEAEHRAAVAAVEASGARARVEERIDTLTREARAALERADLTSEGLMLMEKAVVALTERES
jgi:geranylgeranyl diphosphate synthase type I